MDITKRKFISFPPNRTFVKLQEVNLTLLCEICCKRPAKFLLKNSLIICCASYGYKCSKVVPENLLCYGCGKIATMIQACGPVCGEGTGQIKCPVAAKRNQIAQTEKLKKHLEDPEFRKQRQDKFEATMMEKYGVTAANHLPAFVQKTKDTNMKRYGVEHGPQIPGVFDKARAKYKETHGVDHWTQLESVQNKRRETSLEVYGVENAIQSKEVTQRRREHNFEKYGVGHPQQVPEIAQARYATWLKNNHNVPFGSMEWSMSWRNKFMAEFGVDHPSKLPKTTAKWHKSLLQSLGVDIPMRSAKVRATHEQTMLSRYGVKNPGQSEVMKEKARQTNIEKFGVPFALQNETIKEKYRENNMKKYGVPYPASDPEIYRTKILPAMYRTHKLTLPSGRIVNYQGYENRAILFLLRSFTENEILFNSEISFPWIDPEGDRHTYFPDLCIKSKQVAVEVKSEYTLKLALADGTLYQKLLAVRFHGWLPVVQLWDEKGDTPMKVFTLDDFFL